MSSRENKNARHYGAPLGPAKKSKRKRPKAKDQTIEERAAAIEKKVESGRQYERKSRRKALDERDKPPKRQKPTQTQRVTPEGTSVIDALRKRDEHTRRAVEKSGG